MACIAPNGFGGLALDISGTLALAGALDADLAAVAGLLPSIRAGMMAGVAKSQREADRDG
jgi:hypothetical protein